MRRIRLRWEATGAPTQGRDSERASGRSACHSGQESWRESDKSRVREGRVLAVKKGFLPYDSGAVFVRQLRGPHLST